MKDKITVILFISYIMIFSIFHIILKDDIVSSLERRKLNTFPEFEMNSEYITKLDKYLLDHFPLRDNFRSVKANFNYKILNKLDNNNIYLKDNYIFKSEYPTNKKSVENFKNKILKLQSMLNNNNVYMVIIPNKNYYLKSNNFLHIDYDYIYNEIDKLNINNIDIKNIMKLSDYYETDTHWKQEKLDKVIKELSKFMNFNYEEIEYEYNTYDKFYGVYYGESAINRNPEILTYLTNNKMDNIRVEYLENPSLNKIYNISKLDGLDSYDIYLDGASSLIKIYNDNIKEKKELIIFRDSFGSSLAPLLVNYYSEITIIDNRYINSENILKYVEFNDQDVLFIYSTLIINNSFSLKG